MKDLLRRLGQRIRELRTQRGWSQEEFADVCHVHRTYMGHLERGEKNLSFGSILKVASALDVTLSELFAGLESGESQPVGNRQQVRRRSSKWNLDQILQEVTKLEASVRKLKEIVRS